MNGLVCDYWDGVYWCCDGVVLAHQDGLIWDCVKIFFCMGYFVADIFTKFHYLFSDVKKETVTFPSALQFDCVHRYFLEV